MSIPEFSVNESENFNSFGGLVILNEMHRKKNNTPVVIVTQYEIFGEGPLSKTSEAIDYECKEAFDNYKGMIIYSSTKDRWKEELSAGIPKILCKSKSKRQRVACKASAIWDSLLIANLSQPEAVMHSECRLRLWEKY